MELAAITATIQLIIAPVVIVTACALLVNGLLTRYTLLIDRLRALAKDRLDLRLRSDATSDPETLALINRRLGLIEEQVPRVLRHHRMVRNALVAAYSGIACFLVDMFLIALAAFFPGGLLNTLVLIGFLSGTAAALVAVLIAISEIRASHQVIRYEVDSIDLFR
ncbi:MAG: DUF2721 domain-containing protein [Anaerolineae bacterium]|nr:DUF2721 domain-containing protein [Anaerolineae bacterium]